MSTSASSTSRSLESNKTSQPFRGKTDERHRRPTDTHTHTHKHRRSNQPSWASRKIAPCVHIKTKDGENKSISSLRKREKNKWTNKKIKNQKELVGCVQQQGPSITRCPKKGQQADKRKKKPVKLFFSFGSLLILLGIIPSNWKATSLLTRRRLFLKRFLTIQVDRKRNETKTGNPRDLWTRSSSGF